MNRFVVAVVTSCATVTLVGCHGTAAPVMPSYTVQQPAAIGVSDMRNTSAPWSAQIKHVVIIIQENRTPDNLFNGYPGANTQSWGLNHNGKHVPLIQVSMTAPYDLDHSHGSFRGEYNGGKMNGFDRVFSRCSQPGACPPPAERAYAMVPKKESKPYWDMARQWALADNMFETNQGPSFPAHQYLISGTSTIKTGSSWRAADNPKKPGSKSILGGCDSPTGTKVQLINQLGQSRTTYPCFDRPTLTDLLDAKSIVWHYYEYAYGPGLWYALDAIRHIYNRSDYRTIVEAPADRVLSDVLNGDLEPVIWVTPEADDSDHARITDGSGPSWVASIVNAVGESRFWKDTAIFVTWDDWGGWYDHVRPPMYNSYELGFRVPLLVISPYAKAGYISHKQHEFGSILKFTEETFGLGSLHTTDVRADDLADCFDFKQAPRKFHRIHAPIGPGYFLNRTPSSVSPDDDL